MRQCLRSRRSAIQAFSRDILLSCSPDQHLCQSQFDHLNFTSANGHFLAMGSDVHRSEVNGNGNFLCVYYNTLNTGYGSMTGSARANDIENNYIISEFYSDRGEANLDHLE